jgi:hypothetical protein
MHRSRYLQKASNTTLEANKNDFFFGKKTFVVARQQEEERKKCNCGSVNYH